MRGMHVGSGAVHSTEVIQLLRDLELCAVHMCNLDPASLTATAIECVWWPTGRPARSLHDQPQSAWHSLNTVGTSHVRQDAVAPSCLTLMLPCMRRVVPRCLVGICGCGFVAGLSGAAVWPCADGAAAACGMWWVVAPCPCALCWAGCSVCWLCRGWRCVCNVMRSVYTDASHCVRSVWPRSRKPFRQPYADLLQIEAQRMRQRHTIRTRSLSSRSGPTMVSVRVARPQVTPTRPSPVRIVDSSGPHSAMGFDMKLDRVYWQSWCTSGFPTPQ